MKNLCGGFSWLEPFVVVSSSWGCRFLVFFFSLLHMNPFNFQGQFYSQVSRSVEHEASTRLIQVISTFLYV